MSTPPQDLGERNAVHDAVYWAKPIQQLALVDVPAGAVNLNVQGRRVVGPIQGFGQMWQKTFRVPLAGAAVSPAEVVRIGKQRFTTLWPAGRRFYPAGRHCAALDVGPVHKPDAP